MNIQEAELAKQKMQINHEELISRLTRASSQDGIWEVFPGLSLYRFTAPPEPWHLVYKPALGVIAQGSKEVFLGEDTFRYSAGQYLITTLTLPVVSRIIEATPEKPYLSLRLDLDPAVVASVFMESGLKTKKSESSVKAMDVSSVDGNLLDAVVRLVRLLDTPDEMQALAVLTTREIIYRLLKGEQAARLTHLLSTEGETRRISKAVKQLRDNFSKTLKIEDIARDLGMSVSSFHHHFKSVTAMSPVQFQKQLRLQEARRLMLGEDMDVASAGIQVGYDNPAYFSREYKKHFGAPPQRDIANLRINLGQ